MTEDVSSLFTCLVNPSSCGIPSELTRAQSSSKKHRNKSDCSDPLEDVCVLELGILIGACVAYYRMKWEWIVYFARYPDFGTSGKQYPPHLAVGYCALSSKCIEVWLFATWTQ
jgi:hypothetical protein